MNLAGFLKAAKAVGGALLTQTPEIMELFEDGVKLLRPGDQETAKAGLEDIIADNAEGFARLDAKLAAAEKLPSD